MALGIQRIFTMSHTISVSNSAEDIWMIKNSIYYWFIDLVIDHCSDDEEVVSKLLWSTHGYGLALDDLFKENAQVAQRILNTVRLVANEVASGEHVLVDGEGIPVVDIVDDWRDSFAELNQMLERKIKSL